MEYGLGVPPNESATAAVIAVFPAIFPEVVTLLRVTTTSGFAPWNKGRPSPHTKNAKRRSYKKSARFVREIFFSARSLAGSQAVHYTAPVTLPISKLVPGCPERRALKIMERDLAAARDNWLDEADGQGACRAAEDRLPLLSRPPRAVCRFPQHAASVHHES